MPLRLPSLPFRTIAHVAHIDWQALSLDEGRRLRELGLDEGVEIELLHRGGWLGLGPLACRVGRMIVAMRANHADAVTVRPASDDMEPMA